MSQDTKAVHNHGPESGPGILCPERLMGQCVIDGYEQKMEWYVKRTNWLNKELEITRKREDGLQAKVRHLESEELRRNLLEYTRFSPTLSKICCKCGEPAGKHGEFGFRDHAPRDADGNEIQFSEEERLRARRDDWESAHQAQKERADYLQSENVRLQAEVDRLKSLPICPWCDPLKEGGYVPCPMHNGPERAYRFIGNQDAEFESNRARKAEQQVRERQAEIEQLKDRVMTYEAMNIVDPGDLEQRLTEQRAEIEDITKERDHYIEEVRKATAEIERLKKDPLCQALTDPDCCCHSCLKDAAIEKWIKYEDEAKVLRVQIERLTRKAAVSDRRPASITKIAARIHHIISVVKFPNWSELAQDCAKIVQEEEIDVLTQQLAEHRAEIEHLDGLADRLKADVVRLGGEGVELRHQLKNQQAEIERLVEALVAQTPSSRKKGCWCPIYHNLENGHSKQCQRANAALEAAEKRK